MEQRKGIAPTGRARELGETGVGRGRRRYRSGERFRLRLGTDTRRLAIAYRSASQRAAEESCSAFDELLADEFYRIEKQLKLAHDSIGELEPSRLPVFLSGEWRGVPRIYALLSSYLGAGAEASDLASLCEFLEAYQEKNALTTYELAAAEPMLRLALIEHAAKLVRSNDEEREGRLELLLAGFSRLSDADLSEAFEALNRASAVLAEDPTYLQMDRESRSVYLSALARLARRTGASETEAARAALALARTNEGDGADERRAQAGYYIIAEGRSELIKRLSPRKKSALGQNSAGGARLALFVGLNALFTLMLTFAAALSDRSPFSGLLALIPAAAVSNALIMALFPRIVKPRPLVRLNLSPRLDGQYRTLLCVPVLIAGEGQLEEAVKTLERHYLADRAENVEFLVLGDFKDADESTIDGDAALLERAGTLIRELNERYPCSGGERFHFIHRERRLSKSDGRYMGRERKRGAIEALVRYLNGEEADEFILNTPELKRNFRYLAVLDADTVLPSGALIKLIGAAAHPLNRPVYAADTDKRPYAGYNIIVPRMASTSRSAARTRFCTLVSGDSGMSAYSMRVSDFYFDVFASGNFGGKGLIDVRGFWRAVNGAIPENTVLSHDLLEGELSRAALDSMTVLYDGEPDNFFSYMKRRHRWLRGDIQLLPFLFSKGGGLEPLSKVKLLSNMLAAVTNGFCLFALTAGAAFKLPAAIFFALFALFASPILLGVDMLVRLVRERSALRPLVLITRRRLMELAALPYSAYRDADAVLRALHRTLFSHKNMLEWQTAAQTSSSAGGELLRLLPSSAFGLFIAAAALLRLLSQSVGVFAFIQYALAALAGMLMLLFPLIVRRLNAETKRPELSPGDRTLLFETARRIWRFFDESCTEKTHFLPPDNIQLEPYLGAAELTSPTNIGMAILAAVSANDLGFIGAEELIDRLEKMADTLEKMEKWRGIPFNWYDVRTLSLPLPRFVSTVDAGNLFCCLVSAACAVQGQDDAALKERAEGLCERLIALAQGMELSALYDGKKRLFHIGCEFDEGRLTRSWYDLFASESRLTSFAAIAFLGLEARHWTALSRLAVDASGGRTLKSWSGTAFEYLMPLIFFETVPHSLQHESCAAAVLTEVLTSGEGEPWGASESGYFAFDDALRYQYHAFGNAELALSRKRGRERVFAPYASLLALAVCPELAMENLRLLKRLGAVGEYGFYEAVDMSEGRVGEGNMRIVKSFMAHHQGMGLAAINNALNDNILAKRFMALPVVAAHEQLLFESFPADPIRISRYRSEVFAYSRRKRRGSVSIAAAEDSPRAGVVSNGRLTALLAPDGRGQYRFLDVLLTRHRRESGAERGMELIVAADGRAKRVSGEMRIEPHRLSSETRLSRLKLTRELAICAESDYGVEKLKVVNRGRTRVRVTLCAFAEVALASAREDEAHPAFARLCVDSERPKELDGSAALFFSRRRAKKRGSVLFFDVISERSACVFTDGLLSPSRGGVLAAALRMHSGELCPRDFDGASSEPYFSAFTELELGAGESGEMRIVFGAAESREAALELIRSARRRLDTLELTSRPQASVRLDRCGAGERELELASLIAYCILADAPAGKSAEAARYFIDEKHENAPQGRHRLWRFALSGDLPILLVRTSELREAGGVRLVLAACRYLAACGVELELAIVNEQPYSYENRLKSRLEGMARDLAFCRLVNAFELKEGESELLECAALVSMDAADPFAAFSSVQRASDARKGQREGERLPALECRLPEGLFEANGFGGFDTEKGEYTILLKKGVRTPLPWSNVLAGKRLGSLVTESGGGYTFMENARLERLTPWSNDALTDKKGERITLFEQESGRVLPLTPDGEGEQLVSHGFLYTRFLTRTAGLEVLLTEVADGELPLKYYRIELENREEREKKLALELECDLVLGESPRREHIVTRAEVFGVRAVNPLGETERTAFLALAHGGRLISSRTGETAAIRSGAVLPRMGKGSVTLLLGWAEKGEDITKIIEKASFERAMERARSFKSERIDRLKLTTGDKKFDLLAGEYLLRQLYSSRLMAKTGFYQSGGATGFRDQLQDASALLLTDPKAARAQLILSAGKQFPEGDVLHWWHGDGRGIRTRISDDRLFLPLVASEYALVTGDESALEQQCPFLESKPIEKGRDSRYELFEGSKNGASLLEHCLRAVELTLSSRGAHGLALMGTGDWNDGMDALGDGAESMLTSLLAVIAADRLLPFVQKHGETERGGRIERSAASLKDAIERAWNGRRYIRAYFGDGAPLDIADLATACFAVFAEAEHSREAFYNALAELEDRENGLVRLLSPPFHAPSGMGKKTVGYIENYIPGVRENGGQYTHAAAWAVIAACKLGDAETAERIFRELDPIEHGSSAAIGRYMTEPYAVCGDVYSTGSLAGRGGWSLYTGAAGWLYRAATEHILGLKKRGSTLKIAPCTTKNEFTVEYRLPDSETRFVIRAVRTEGEKKPASIELVDDGQLHRVFVEY